MADELQVNSIIADVLKRSRAKKDPARTDYAEFRKRIMRGRRGEIVHASAFNHVLADTMSWCRTNNRHLAHMGPPALGKSTEVRTFLTWLAGNDPASSTVVISAEEKVARRQIGECRKLVLSPQFREVFPEVQPDIHRGKHRAQGTSGEDAQGFSMREFFFRVPGRQSPDPAFAADAADPKSEARRVDVLFADDVMSRHVAESKAERERLIDAFRRTWLDGRLAESGFAIVTHNCWTDDDLIHVLQEDPRFLHLYIGVDDSLEKLFVEIRGEASTLPLMVDPAKYGAEPVSSAKGTTRFLIPLPPGRVVRRIHAGVVEEVTTWTKEWLKAKRDSNPSNFRQQWNLIAASPDDLMFPSWPNRTKAGASVAEIMRVPEQSGLPMVDDLQRTRFRFVAGVDLSSSKRKGTRLSILAQEISTRRMNIAAHEMFKGAKVVEQLVEAMERLWLLGLRPDKIVVEDNGVQDLIVEAIRAMAGGKRYDWAGRIVTYTTTGPTKLSPETGLPAIETEIGTGAFVWPSGEAARNPNWQALEDEFARCPRFLSAGETPDGPMSVMFARKGLGSRGPSGTTRAVGDRSGHVAGF